MGSEMKKGIKRKRFGSIRFQQQLRPKDEEKMKQSSSNRQITIPLRVHYLLRKELQHKFDKNCYLVVLKKIVEFAAEL